MTGDETAAGACFFHRSKSTSCPDSDLIVTRFGVKCSRSSSIVRGRPLARC